MGRIANELASYVIARKVEFQDTNGRWQTSMVESSEVETTELSTNLIIICEGGVNIRAFACGIFFEAVKRAGTKWEHSEKIIKPGVILIDGETYSDATRRVVRQFA